MKRCKKAISLLLVAVLLATPVVTAATNAPPPEAGVLSAAATGSLRVENLTVENHENPLGVDIEQPNLAWNLSSDGYNQRQSAYRILVASTREKLDANEGDLWDTTVESDKNYCNLYGGKPLQSRQRAYWKVMVWDANGKASDWSEPAWWEAALVNEADWSAKWIGKEEKDLPGNSFVTNELPETTARYVRLKVTGTGPSANAEKIQRIQIMEWEVFSSENPDINLAADKKASATNVLAATGTWSASCLTDGSAEAGYGYSTGNMNGVDLAASPVYITIDLGSPQTFDAFTLYGRTDAVSTSGAICPNFPKEYDVEISDDGTNFTQLRSVSVEKLPEIPMKSTRLPLFAKEFEVDREKVASARLYISGLGLYEAHLNGQNVADTLFDPGETDFRDRVTYVTYDVTDKLFDGVNAIGVELGNGNYNMSTTPGRYQKHNYSMGADKLIAQLELTMKDGAIQTVASDESWFQTDGPITFSTWYGGEDYDATQEVDGWDLPGTDRSAWAAAAETVPPTGKLVARNTPPIRITEQLDPVGVSKLANGNFLVDFGRNFAGVFKMDLSGLTAEDRGTKIEFWPSELLKSDGTIDQGATGSPIWDSYTIKGESSESYQLTFMYHGFRYLQVKNAPVELTADNFTGYVVRTDNEKTGTFETSSDTLNQINEIINVAVESNMYSVLTDCPHREKLGWLEVSHLMYYSMAYNFDIQSWMKKITLDMTDAQISNGMVPSIAPEFYLLSTQFRNDPTWGGAAILDPWYTYQIYGDDSLLETAYPMMSQYIEFLNSQAKGNLVDFGLGDWGAYDASTPRGLVVSATYYNLVDVMSQIADKLGRADDAEAYRALAGKIKTAYNEKYFDPKTGQYGSGSQASYACPLFAKLVPDDQIDRVLDNLVANIQSRDWHLSTGEVGLRQMFVVLAEYGRSDVVYKMATNQTMPSYWYFIENGRTALPEYWDMHGSQNHCMMGHIQEWFYRYLAGIDHDEPGFKKAVIKPFVPDDLAETSASTMTSYGEIASSWSHDLVSGKLTMKVKIPVGTTADVYVPAFGRETEEVQVNGTTVKGTLEGDSIKLEGLGSGSYELVREPANIVSFALSADRSTLEIGELAEYAGIDEPVQIRVTALTDEGDSIALSPKAVSLSSSNDSVASVDPETGLVTGHQIGSVTITASKDGQSAKTDIQVREAALTELSLNPSKRALNYVGDELWMRVSGTLDTGQQVDLTGFDQVSVTSESPDVQLRPSGAVKLVSRGTVGEQILFTASYQDTKAETAVRNGNAQNLARALGTTVRVSSASKAETGAYKAESAVNGDRTGNKWGKGGGWSDSTKNVWNDWYQVDFDGKKTISSIDLTFLQDNYAKAAVPTLETTCKKYPVDKVQVQYWDGSDWQTIENGNIVDNNKAWVQIGFEPINTNRVRVFYADPVGDFARLVEIEIWEDEHPADNSLAAQVDGTERRDLFTYTYENGTYSVVPNSQAILEAAGDSAQILIKATEQTDRMTIEFETELVDALKDKGVSFALDNGRATLTATASQLFQQDKLNQATSVTSKPVILFTLETGEKCTGTVLYTNFDKRATASIDPVVPSDKSILKAVLDYAQAAVDNGETQNLIPTVRDQFDRALAQAKAVYDSTASTQQEVDAAWPSLMKAIHMLGFQAGDKTRLNALIESAEQLNPDDYENGVILAEALESANAVNNDDDALVAEVDQATAALEDALSRLVLKNWLALSAAFDYAHTLDLTAFVPQGQEAFGAALAKAQEVIENRKSSQAQIDSAYTALVDTLTALRYRADKSLLEELLSEVTSVDTTLYTPATLAVFQAALNEANAILNDDTLTRDEGQQKVDSAVNTLREAYRGLAPIANGSPMLEQNRPAATGDAGASPMAALLAAVAAAVALKRKKQK